MAANREVPAGSAHLSADGTENALLTMGYYSSKELAS